MKLMPLLPHRNYIEIVDQRKLPNAYVRIICRNAADVYEAIQKMKIRGAPAIGTAGAFGLYLGMRYDTSRDAATFFKKMKRIGRYLISARPTAVNLAWAVERMQQKAAHCSSGPVAALQEILYREARAILKDDQERSKRMGVYGARLIRRGDGCLTICNAGGMATSGFGSALSVFFEAKKQKKRFEVFACETRPLLQGARITCWELKQMHIKTTLLCDSMAASLMQRGLIQNIFVGADRITMSGDFANKIGTYQLAIAARHHGIPFYVVAPLSTFDPALRVGGDIPIEYRKPEEVTDLYFKRPIAPRGIAIMNPAFDMTASRYVTAFITERGIMKPPYRATIRKIIHGSTTQAHT